MNRVSIINLAGRAFHVDEDGATSIAVWLEHARTRLVDDPDRDELLLDFERAIADRCDAFVDGDRDVVTAAEVSTVLEALGSVEPTEQSDARPTEDEPTTENPTAQVPLRERRLYRLTDGDEAMIAGVCSGIAAYLNVDVTVVRVLTVLLALLTSGGAAILYIAMALIVPEANTPERRTAVRGYGESAQEILSRARSNAGPALASVGELFNAAWRIVVMTLHVLAIATVWILLAVWATAVIWIVADGDGLMRAFDAGTSRWLAALWVTSIAWVGISAALLVARWTGRPHDAGGAAPRRGARVARDTAWGVSFVVALVGIFVIPISASSDLRALEDGQGRITIGDTTICLEAQGEQPTRSERCRRGDEVIVTD